MYSKRFSKVTYLYVVELMLMKPAADWSRWSAPSGRGVNWADPSAAPLRFSGLFVASSFR